MKFPPSLNLTLTLTHLHTLCNLLSRTLDIAKRTRLHLWGSDSGSLTRGYVRNAAIDAVESPVFVLAIVRVIDCGNGEVDI